MPSERSSPASISRRGGCDVRDVDWRVLIDALIRVEGIEPDDAGLLWSPAAAGAGGIFVEGGRICWAAAPGLRRRLSDLLSTCTSGPVDLDQLYARCRADGRPLGQTLVDEGWLAPHQLEVVLRRHSAESLVALCRAGALTRWSSRGGRGYSPRFTFRPVDVLFDVVALFAPHAQQTARAELAALDGPGRRGAAFVLHAGHDAVPVAASGDATVGALATLGSWATAVPSAARELGASRAFVLAATAGGDTISLWWRDGLLFAVACEDRAEVAAVTAHHLACA